MAIGHLHDDHKGSERRLEHTGEISRHAKQNHHRHRGYWNPYRQINANPSPQSQATAQKYRSVYR